MSSSMQQEYTVYISWKHSLTGKIGTNRYAISSFACGVVGSVLTGEDSQHLISDILLTFAMCSTKMRDCRLFLGAFLLLAKIYTNKAKIN